MHCIKIFFFLLLASFLFSCEPTASKYNALDGKVVAISDGDTFILLVEKEQIKIRLYGIDCPEKKQEYGQVARQKLSELIFDKQVHVVQKDTDRYGRTVALVYDAQNKCINEEMLKAGLAWHYTNYDTNPVWQKLEEDAKASRLGLWSTSDPTPPWQWRKR